MNVNGQKLVDFSLCRTCIHFAEKDEIDICHDCLNEPVNTYSSRPVNYVKKEVQEENED